MLPERKKEGESASHVLFPSYSFIIRIQTLRHVVCHRRRYILVSESGDRHDLVIYCIDWRPRQSLTGRVAPPQGRAALVAYCRAVASAQVCVA